jgi:hypothetical protein
MAYYGSIVRRSLLVLAAVACVRVAAVPLARAAGGYPTDGGTVVVHYQEALGELAEGGPSLTVYGDGRAVAHWPGYMKRAGDYDVQLSPREMDALVSSLVANGVLDVDTAALRRAVRDAKAAERAAGAPITIVSDPDVTTIELTTVQGRRTVRWAGLREAAREHPDIPAIQALHAAREDLVGVMDRAYGAHK